MYSTVSVISPPAAEPVSLQVLQEHARIDYDYDNTLLGMYLSGARQAVEQFLGRVLITQTLRWVMAHQAPINQFPLVPFTAYIFPMWMPYSMLFQRPIELPRAPVQAINSISVGEWGTADTVLSADQYSADLMTDPGRVRLHAGVATLPSDHISIEFVAGYGNDGTAVPVPIQLAILLMATFLYEHRGDDGGDMPDAVKNLLWPYRLYAFGDPDA
ncbi:phage head-tail connector protein [Komagataeibacter xylinus]|uniref:Phage gp6-like head-tail connector protein n=1 Tax=Komagataeibacter xylinus TaxID=28448 RepID=A0A857FQ61_KOMXY|nr:phage head-tail connector protein [Komagataeibacter xylinus]QHC35357.1 hypothetical protein FMA36_07455 [Komagataeibacter xylinus]